MNISAESTQLASLRQSAESLGVLINQLRKVKSDSTQPKLEQTLQTRDNILQIVQQHSTVKPIKPIDMKTHCAAKSVAGTEKSVDGVEIGDKVFFKLADLYTKYKKVNMLRSELDTIENSVMLVEVTDKDDKYIVLRNSSIPVYLQLTHTQYVRLTIPEHALETYLYKHYKDADLKSMRCSDDVKEVAIFKTLAKLLYRSRLYYHYALLHTTSIVAKPTAIPVPLQLSKSVVDTKVNNNREQIQPNSSKICESQEPSPQYPTFTKHTTASEKNHTLANPITAVVKRIKKQSPTMVASPPVFPNLLAFATVASVCEEHLISQIMLPYMTLVYTTDIHVIGGTTDEHATSPQQMTAPKAEASAEESQAATAPLSTQHNNEETASASAANNRVDETVAGLHLSKPPQERKMNAELKSISSSSGDEGDSVADMLSLWASGYTEQQQEPAPQTGGHEGAINTSATTTAKSVSADVSGWETTADCHEQVYKRQRK